MLLASAVICLPPLRYLVPGFPGYVWLKGSYMFNKWIRLPLNSPKNHPTKSPGVSPSIVSGRPRLGAARGALRSPSTTAAVDAPGTAAWQRRGLVPGMSIRSNGYFN
jgi:hypothetical protein